MPSTQDRKRELRTASRAERAARPADEQDAVAAGLLSTGSAAAALAGARVVAAYVATPGEPDLGPLRTELRRRGTTVLLPVSGGDGRLRWGLDDGILRPGPRLPSGRSIDEPVTTAGALGLRQTDVVLLPALAVDLAGARLGQGGGFYDRALAELDDERGGAAPLLVAVVHDTELLPAGAVPTQPHDRRVHAVLTPTRWLALTPTR